MDRDITRRDFLDGGSMALATAGLSVSGLAAAAGRGGMTVSPPTRAYPPSLLGLRGQDQSAMGIGHAVRDGSALAGAVDTGETYDLIVVGAGLSGLAAAYFYRKAFGRAKVLILDNMDDFGGHSRRNEMTINGQQVLGPAGAMDILNVNSFLPSGRQLLDDIGIDADRFAVEEKAQSTQYAEMGMTSSAFFDKETFGVDRLVVGNPLGFSGFASAADPGTLEAFLAKAPLSEPVKRSLMTWKYSKTDYFPGLNREQKIAKLRTMSYQSYLLDVMKLDPGVMAVLYRLDGGATNGALGMDTISAFRAFTRKKPGFDGLDLGPKPSADWTAAPAKMVTFPDGNGGVARLIVRWLIPDALSGSTMEDSVVPHVDYGVLDRPTNDVRLRLSSTVVNARHDGDVATAGSVTVTYVKDGQVLKARSANVVMACFNAIIPYLCPEIGEAQKDALHMAVRMPLVTTNVMLRNWKAHEKLGTSNIYFPSGFYNQATLAQGVSLGAYRRAPTPDDPTNVNLWTAVMTPDSGLDARDQYRAGRARLLGMSFEQLERSARDQLSRALAGGGFDPRRDIAGIVVNRWAHGYAGCANDLFDPDWNRDELPWVVGRKRFGRIGIANSDAGAACLMQAAVDQAHRAVTDLIDATVRPSYGYQWGERS